MRVRSTREIHVSLDESEANGIINALTSVLHLLADEQHDESILGEDLLLKLKTELINAPR